MGHSINKCRSSSVHLFSIICHIIPEKWEGFPHDHWKCSHLVMCVIDVRSSEFQSSLWLLSPECFLCAGSCFGHQELNGAPIKIPVLLEEINSN